MTPSAKTGVPLIGIVFLLLALFKFLNGGPWVVWLILGLLLGGFGIFGLNRSKEEGS
jgi:hypothetical protein